MNKQQIQILRNGYAKGQVFAYPTEAVFGLGCDPQNRNAVYEILKLKSREVEKGLILIASNFEQIKPYVLFEDLPDASQDIILASWPGPVTWLLPKSPFTPFWLSGDSNMIAVRITSHPLVRIMCEELNQAIVSTSANPAGMEPAKSIHQIHTYFADAIANKKLAVIEGDLGQQDSPSKIFHSLTMETIRA